MRIGILAGGVGLRLADETERRPKPMVEIGDRPILWHIMKYYMHFGFDEFVIALGYKGDDIKKYIVDHDAGTDNVPVDSENVQEKRDDLHPERERWKVQLVETGLATNTGGRIKRLAPYLGTNTFMLTYGDGLANVDLHGLLAFHRSHRRLATVTAVRPPARFGKLNIDGNVVTCFSEKPQRDEGWINGAFFVLEPKVLDYIDGDDTPWEREPLERLARDGQLMAYKHDAFWQCMDTPGDKKLLDRLWESTDAPWKVW